VKKEDLTPNHTQPHIVGYFDTIEEMHKVYARHKGHTALSADANAWRLGK